MTSGRGESARGPKSSDHHPGRSFGMVLVALTTVMLLASLNASSVNTALPRMASDLGGLDHIAWIITAFMLCMTVSTPLYGKLSDMYGRRAILIASIGLTLLASVLCALAHTMLQLILARGLQGLGAGGLLILSQTVIADLVPPRERGRYLGVVTGAMTIGSVIGPVVGGWLTESFSWRWVFLINLPVGGFALVLILLGLKATPRPSTHHVDYVGAALLTVGTVAAMLLLGWAGSAIAWLSSEAAALAGVAAAGFTAFYAWEKRASEPLVDLDLLRRSDILLPSLASSLISFAMAAMLVFLPLYLQLVIGLDPIDAGLATLPQVFAMLVSSLLFGAMLSRYGRPRLTLIGGTVFQIAGLAALVALAAAKAPLSWFLPALAVFGLGQGVAMPSATLIVQAMSRPEQLGMATSTIAFIRSFGGAAGVAVSGGVMAALLQARLARLPVQSAELTRQGFDAIAGLQEPLRLAVLDAYRFAIVGSFVVSLGVMLLALGMALAVRDDVLPEGV